MAAAKPDVVFHLAAQSFVPEAFTNLAGTFSNNVVGQINLFEALRGCGRMAGVLVVGSWRGIRSRPADEDPVRQSKCGCGPATPTRSARSRRISWDYDLEQLSPARNPRARLQLRRRKDRATRSYWPISRGRWPR